MQYKEEIEKLLFETELPSKECEALTQKLLCLYSVSNRISDEEIEEIAKKEIPYSNGCYGEGEHSEGKRDGFEEGLEYYRDKIL